MFNISRSKLNLKFNYFPLLTSFLLLVPLANAQQIQSQGDYSKIASKFSSLEAGRAASYSANNLDFVFQIENLGTLKVSFTESPQDARNASFSSSDSTTNDIAKVLLLRGDGYLNGNPLPVAGSVFRVDGKEELHINFVDSSDDSSTLGGKAHEIIQPLDGSNAVLRTASKAMYAGKKCGSEEFAPFSASNAKRSGAVHATVTQKVIDIATVADYQYYLKYGSSSNSRIASIINAAQVIYERDLSLRFNVVRQNVYTTSAQPYASTDSAALLEKLGDEVVAAGGLNGADIVHLFTGKDLDEDTVGLAWLNATCGDAYYSTSLTQDLDPTLDFIIFAHELGHNLGAPHDESLPVSVMYPSVSEEQTAFSVASMSKIAEHLAAGGDSCFATVDAPAPEPTPTPDPREGGDDPVEEEPYLDFWATYNARSGTVDLEVVRNYFYEGTCLAKIKVGGKANLSDAQKYSVRTDSEYLHFIAKTTKRLVDTKAKIYVSAELSECEGGEPTIKSEVLSFKPSSGRTTRKSDKVTVRVWNKDLVRKMKFRNY